MNGRRGRAGVVGAVLVLGGLTLAGAWSLEPALAGSKVDPPSRNSPDEPIAASASLARAAEFLDAVALDWTRTRKCGTCHTNYAYLLARPALREFEGPAMAEIRQFFEGRVAHWDDADPSSRPRWDTEVVATASALAIHDAATTGTLHPTTRGPSTGCGACRGPTGRGTGSSATGPPTSTTITTAPSSQPWAWAPPPTAMPGPRRPARASSGCGAFFGPTNRPTCTTRTFQLWASQKLDGLMTPAQKEKTVERLLALQRPDGGWSLPSLGDWDRRDGTPNDANAPSDGYATGLVVFVLRQTGLPAQDEPIRRGVAWLQTHQRASGRWFTRSLSNDKAHYIANAGTGFAVLALKACDPTEASREKGRPE